MERAFETVLVEQGAPALAGLKSANLFRVEARDKQALYRKVEGWQKALQPRGLSLRILKECDRTASYLIYLYREKQLWAELAQADVQAYLLGQGYRAANSCTGYLDQLAVRLCCQSEFPHEIGVFLGYPLEDVIGFVENKGKNFTCCGCWKAYGDAEAARKRFALYQKCTQVYLRCFHQGTPIIRLAVAA